MADDSYRIRNEAALEAAIGEPLEFVRAKVQQQLNPAMRQFIARSPLIFVSTLDAEGRPDVSPKGDPAGFVRVDASGNLLIPERPGNKLAFGFRNILRGGAAGGEIGLIFVVPNQRETLRVKGRATLHRDPELLADMQVGGKPALVYTRVLVTECFFHCGKALIRSHLWQPDAWDADARPIAARGLMTQAADEAAVLQTEERLERAYRDELY